MYCNKCMNEIPDGTYCKNCMSDNTNTSQPHHSLNYASSDMYSTPVNPVSQQRSYTQAEYNHANHNQAGYNQAGIHRQPGYNPQGNPNNFRPQSNQQGAYNPDGTQKKKSHTALIVTLSVCLLVVIAIAVVVAVQLSTNPTMDNVMNIYGSVPVITQPIADTDSDKSIQMISCLNDNYKDAVKKLEGLGLTVKTEFRYDAYYKKDMVCEQSINAGKTVKKGDTVTLYVSKGAESSPQGYSQKVVVTASSGATSGKLKLYNWVNGDWKEEFSCTATVGKKGISGNYGEGISATPKGTFKLGYLIAPDNIASDNWPYYKSTSNTCIVDDSDSGLYNQIKEKNNLPAGVGYDNIGKNFANGNCCGMLFIEHNGNGLSSDGVVRGNGSAITICGINGALSSTYGCVDISSSDFYTLMSELDYSKNPHIELKN